MATGGGSAVLVADGHDGPLERRADILTTLLHLGCAPIGTPKLR
jgi:hypothetical protein